MLSHRLYYLLKPHLPLPLRMAARRVWARRKLEQYRSVWPILESAASLPSGWPGWPEGKRFAVVFTHDVEGPLGLARCQQLAELERGLGVRSSFNLIPEGAYDVPPALREWLAAHGMEVGVHDLRHDGKLFWSKRTFEKNARRINHYLREWRATGFRSGFMLRNFDWLQQLDIRYDASTFDTDPFELQSDGAGTIFPFWIPAPQPDPSPSACPGPVEGPAPSEVERATGPSAAHRGGYVELPYTLPQDSTLFLVMEETSPEIWLRKVDWVAKHGGMILVNVHPDYICFDGKLRRGREYPAEFYKTLIGYLQREYAGQYWNPLPSELAHWYVGTRESHPAPLVRSTSDTPVPAQLRGKRAAVLLYSSYPSDPRPRRAAEAMVEAGMEVDLLSLSETAEELPHEHVRGVNVYRIPLKRSRASRGAYIWQYGRFLLSSFWFLARRGLGRRYDVVHVHNMPDVLVFAALVPKLRGARVILDLHDPMPELMTTIYGLKPGHWLVRLLRRLERWSIGFANLALTPNIAFKNLFASRSCRPEKIQIVMNSPQQEIFDPDRFAPGRTGIDDNGEFRIMHHGSIVHRHGIDLLVEAVALLRPRIPGIRLDIYGSATPFLDKVLDLAKHLGVADIVHYHGSKPQTEIADAIRRCHVGVVPNRRSVFTEINFPTRLFEYLSMHRPVIAPNTQGIRDYFKPDQLVMFEPDSVADLAAKILYVHDQPEAVEAMVDRGSQVYRANLWRGEKARFLGLVACLMNRA